MAFGHSSYVLTPRKSSHWLLMACCQIGTMMLAAPVRTWLWLECLDTITRILLHNVTILLQPSNKLCAREVGRWATRVFPCCLRVCLLPWVCSLSICLPSCPEWVSLAWGASLQSQQHQHCSLVLKSYVEWSIPIWLKNASENREYNFQAKSLTNCDLWLYCTLLTGWSGHYVYHIGK